MRLNNAHPAAAFPVLSAGVDALILDFAGRGVVLPALTLSGDFEVTAGGPISQSGNLSIGADVLFAVRGDFGIDLTTHTNTVGGSVQLSAPHSTRAWPTPRPASSGSASDVGRGTLRVTAGDDITQSDSVRQPSRRRPGRVPHRSGATRSSCSSGTTTSPAGDLRRPQPDVGAARNASPFATVPALAGLGRPSTLTLKLPRAAPALPSLTLPNLDVTASGIYQQAGSALVVGGKARFNGLRRRPADRGQRLHRPRGGRLRPGVRGRPRRGRRRSGRPVEPRQRPADPHRRRRHPSGGRLEASSRVRMRCPPGSSLPRETSTWERGPTVSSARCRPRPPRAATSSSPPRSPLSWARATSAAGWT